jgi:hypothetical protein
MWARKIFGLVTASLLVSACGSSGVPNPTPTSVTPNSGFAGNDTAIVIHGTGFSVRTVQPSSGGAPTVDDTFQAWLGNEPLTDVRRVDEETIHATVPKNRLAPGAKTLRVQGPFGTSGELASAFTVVGSSLASISASIAATPTTVSVGQSITITLTVTNTGTTAATNAAPNAPTVTGTGTVAAPTGPDPVSIATLAPGASGTFTWNYPTTGPGTLAFEGSASATDSFSGKTVTGASDPAQPAQVTVENPAALTASLPASGAAAVGQEFTVAMTVRNSGAAAAKDVVPSLPTMAPTGRATLKPGTGPVPASVALLAAGASTPFTWTFVAGTTSGTVVFSASASGTDANSGAAVASGSASSGNFVIGAAGLDATLSAAPAAANVGQAVTLTLTVKNPGLADVRNFAVAPPTVNSTDGANATRTAGPVPVPPAVLVAGQTLTITWTYNPALTTGVSTGHVSFGVSVSGTDAFSGGTITAQAATSATVQAPAALAATLALTRTPPVPTGQPFTVNVTQPFTATLEVTNTGAAPALDVTPTAITICAAPSPVSATVSPGTPVVFAYANCSSAVAGTLALSASASGTDANNPALAVTSNAAGATATVQAPAAVSASSLVASPATVNTGQTFSVTLTLSKTGTAPANVTAVSLTGITCTNPPSVPVPNIPASQALTWTGCTAPGTAQTLSLSATATWVDQNTGTSATTTPVSRSVQVQVGAGVSASSLVASPATVNTGQTFSVTLTLSKTGTAPANVTAVSLTGITCTNPPSVPVPNIPASQAFTWTGCTAPGIAQTIALAATATWVDQNTGTSATTNPASTPVQVQAPAALSATIAFSPAPVPSAAQFDVTMQVNNTGTATANNVIPGSLALTGPGTATLTASPFPATFNIPGGSSHNFVWTFTNATQGDFSVSGSASGTDANSGLPTSAPLTSATVNLQ